MVYFVQATATGLIKIGKTHRIIARLTALSQEAGELSVLGTIDGYGQEEKDLHRQFAHLRQHGEWFSPGSDLLSFIKDNATPWDKEQHSKPMALEFTSRVRRALLVHAYTFGKSPSQVVSALIEEHFQETLGLIDKHDAERKRPD